MIALSEILHTYVCTEDHVNITLSQSEMVVSSFGPEKIRDLKMFYSPIQLLQTMSGNQALFDHGSFFHCAQETSRPLFPSDAQYLGGRFKLNQPSSWSTSRRRLLAIFSR